MSDGENEVTQPTIKFHEEVKQSSKWEDLSVEEKLDELKGYVLTLSSRINSLGISLRSVIETMQSAEIERMIKNGKDGIHPAKG